MRLTRAEIKLSNLKFNYLNIRKKVSNSLIMAVVKADAYGHGMIQTVSVLEKLNNKKPAYYGVAFLEEGIELRKSKVTKSPILIFSPFKKEEVSDSIKFKLMPTVTSEQEIKELSKLELNKKLKVHINIDTGMGRVGLPFEKAFSLVEQLSKVNNIIIDGIYTHFATSDERNKKFSELQLKRFIDVIDKLNRAKIEVGSIHAANSGAILDLPNTFLDMVRVGISLYGYYPSTETSESVKLKPVMALLADVASVTEVKKGTSISYGRKYKTKNDTKIVSVSIGYADGINRSLTNKMFCIIKNRKYPQVGTITMDRIMFDVGDAKIKVDDKVILLGKSKNEVISVSDWCRTLNTIPYEITCGISKRVPRKYI
ncbi:MAG: alanine racemase [Melioribacteraceae bacterium]|nr:alanine racemase [Melioribacteraceae bacterium]